MFMLKILKINTIETLHQVDLLLDPIKKVVLILKIVPICSLV